MKRPLTQTTAPSMKKVVFTVLGCAMLMFIVAPAWAQVISDQGVCNGALVDGVLGDATGCGALITVTAVNGSGQATAFNVTIPNNNSPANGNPYDGDDDILVGVLNSSGAPLSSLPLTSSDTTFGGIFGFDGDGPCDYTGGAADCLNGPYPELDPNDYEGPDNTFTNISSISCTTTVSGLCYTSGTVTFTTPIPPANSNSCGAPCNSTWFALEGTPNSLILTSESAMLNYPTSANPETEIASFGSGAGAHTAAFTLKTVINPVSVTVTANYVDVGQVGLTNGICPFGTTVAADNDIDCRLALGGFVFDTLVNGDMVVPHCIPYHNYNPVTGTGQCVWYRASTPAVAGTDYTGPVYDGWTFPVDPSLANPSPNPEYPPGWNNQIGRVYDRPGVNLSNAFVADITDFFSSEPSAGGHQSTLNDWVLAAVPNGFEDTEITLVPIPGISPAPYIKGLPMLVALDLEKLGTKIPDPNGLMLPNTIRISTSTSGPAPVSIPVQFPQGLPTTFSNVCTKAYCPLKGVYYIFLSSTPYSTYPKGTTFNMYIGSDLFPQITLQFVVK